MGGMCESNPDPRVRIAPAPQWSWAHRVADFVLPTVVETSPRHGRDHRATVGCRDEKPTFLPPSRRLFIPAMVALMLVATPMPAAAGGGLTLTPVESGFANPLFVTHAGDSRLFVVEKCGLVKIVGGSTFLDVSSEVDCNPSSERGLLGLAFDPNYATNGLFYIDYTRASDGDVVIAERRRSAAMRTSPTRTTNALS